MLRSACLMSIALGLAAAQPVHAQQEVKIGSAEPVSGPSAHLGKDTENGARLAIEDLNATGATIDGKKVKWVLLTEDDGGDPKQGTAVAQKLVDAGVVAVVGRLNSGTTVPASKIYNNAGIPQITPAATTPLYTHQGFRSAFRVVANDNMVGGALARYAVGTLKARRIAVIDDRTAFGQGLADEFVKGVKRAGGAVQIVGRQFTNDKATDFNAILTQIRAQRPDVIFFGGMDAVAGPMLKQMKALGITTKFVSGDGICSAMLSVLAGDALGDDQVTCAVAGGVSGKQEAIFDAFITRFRQRFNLEPENYSPYAFDAVMVIAAAMQQAKSSDPAKFKPVLAKIKYQGVTGTIAFDINGDLRDAALTLYTYRKGKKTRIRVVR
ncbi:MAG: branched-chain amino acid ABC transporter substrate-binding protein [Pseudomonadota bacterium]|nr:branched-chain amino acid ABC transporter substrate-binding protein [Pseudomonadota bacterium]